MPVKFHLDESVSNVIAAALRRRGIDVTVSRETGLIGAADIEHLSFCAAERRVLVTHDDDFLALHAQRISHAGITYCAPEKRTLGEIIQTLVLLWHALEPEEMTGRIEFL